MYMTAVLQFVLTVTIGNRQTTFLYARLNQKFPFKKFDIRMTI